MDCHYHPEREGQFTCDVCGKSMCEECAVEIAGKTYCKDCLEVIIGGATAQNVDMNEPTTNPISETLQDMETNNSYYNDQKYDRETVIEDVLKNNDPTTQIHDSPYSIENYQDPFDVQEYVSYDNNYINEPFIETEESQIDNLYQEPLKQEDYDDGFIYPDHSYQPPERSGVETKYEQYLDDLYFDEPKVTLSEQLAKDEETYGSLTKSPYNPEERKIVEEVQQTNYEEYIPPNNLPNEGYLDINNFNPNTHQGDYIQPRPPIRKQEMIYEYNQPQRNHIHDPRLRPSNRSIHNLPTEKNKKEPLGAVDIILTIILIILIILVVFYIVYLFVLSSTYPTFTDALFGLTDPQTFINNLLGK